jgi:hypothetical protein
VTNPFSVFNINKALEDLGRTDPLDDNEIYHYYSFDPSKLTGDMLKIIEAEETNLILDFPFANGEVYTDAFSANFEANSNALKDGKLYIVFKNNNNLLELFGYNPQLGATKLDELYMPQESDEALQLQAIANSRNTTIENLKISWPCLFKRPSGRVTYLDQETGTNRGVPKILVLASVFGIPRMTFTNNNGNYSIPGFFSIGTFIGTRAKNLNVNVKPLNTTGGFMSDLGQITANFIIGSLHIEGWRNACQLKKPVNINFNQHNQARYWAQILHSVHLNHEFSAQDDIASAPVGLTWYALWGDTGFPASAPMLSHIEFSPAGLVSNVLSLIFNFDLSVDVPNVYNLFTGLLPSITTKRTPESGSDMHYSERLMGTAFHELAHASLFRQVGEIFWIEIIGNILVANNSPCGSYGCGDEVFAGNTSLNEAWAEYLSKEHHRRLHPNGQAQENPPIGIPVWRDYPDALENVPSFFQAWIPTGVFFDLRDPVGIAGREIDDQVQNVSISQMFTTFSPNTHDFCEYGERFIERFPQVTRGQINLIFQLNDFTLCIR